MKAMSPVVDYVAFEITYGSGHLYFDRCGQCLLDIERQCPGWSVINVDVQTGRLENPGKSFNANFNNQTFNATAQKASRLSIAEIAKEVSGLWKIVQANLGLEEFLRIGFRVNYLLPTESADEAEKLLKRPEINVTLPTWVTSGGYAIKNQQLVVVVVKDGTEYRVELCGVTRHEGMNPSDLVRTDPRVLSKNQKEFRIAKLKQMAEYSANPMFAVDLNVDCARYDPDAPSVEEFILEQAEVVEHTFLPVLKKL